MNLHKNLQPNDGGPTRISKIETSVGEMFTTLEPTTPVEMTASTILF